MGYFLCPTCQTWRHIDEPDEAGPDRCWQCHTPAETVEEWQAREAEVDPLTR